MRRFQYSLISDLHIDTGHHTRMRDYPLEKNVVVAGDVANNVRVSTDYLNKLKDNGHNVFAVDGNHEHYANTSMGRSVAQVGVEFYDLLNQSGTETIDDGLTIIGTNGWYDHTGHEDFWKTWMNDYRYAGDIGCAAAIEADWLDRAIAEVAGKVIVVTHTSPVAETLVWKPWDLDWDRSNKFFYNIHMRDVLVRWKDKILVWNHGHTHQRGNIVVEGVRVVCNPRGYPGENVSWAPVTIEVEY